MNDNELDELFRSNADYLADQPPRDFDKAAFWQHLQTALPRQAAPRKKPRVWGWAAAAVILAGMAGSVWWMQWESKEIKPVLAQQAENISAPKNTERIAPVPRESTPAIDPHKHPSLLSRASDEGTSQGQVTPPRYQARNPEKPQQEVAVRSPMPENEAVSLTVTELARPDTVTRVDEPLPQVVKPVGSGKPSYRVVHINEIKAQKQQETKARTRMALRVGLPAGTRMTPPPDHSSPLSIPIQN